MRQEHKEVSVFSLSTVIRKISNTTSKSIWYNLNTRQTLHHGPSREVIPYYTRPLPFRNASSAEPYLPVLLFEDSRCVFFNLWNEM